MKYIYHGNAFSFCHYLGKAGWKSLLKKQNLRVMKLIALLLTVTSLQLSAKSYAQHITLQVSNAPMAQVFEQVYIQTGYQFVATKSMLKQAHPVSMDVKNASLEEVLKLCFQNQPLTYQLQDKAIIVKQKPRIPTSVATIEALLPPPIHITGTVVDSATGEPLVGVSIKVKGTNAGTVTDAQGKFSLEVEDGAVLEVSSVGYTSKSISVDGKTSFDISLATSATGLNQLIVVGYGTQKKKNLIGAVSSKNIHGIISRPSADIASSLQGSIPGLHIRAASGGDPSITPEINIRGFNSLNGGSPLVLVDGIEEDLADVNPNNIKSVTVLKGAEAAAIYGARAGFGVILITTKKGEAGNMKIEYSNNFAFTTNTTRTDFVTDPYLYMKTMDDAIHAYNGSHYAGNYTEEDFDILKKVGEGKIKPYYEKQPDGTYKFYGNTDFYNYLFKKWRISRVHNISVSGGSEKLSGYFSGRIYKRQKIGKIQNPEMKRYNLYFNLNFKPYKWLELSTTSKFSKRFSDEYAGTVNGWGDPFGSTRWRDLYPIYPPEINGIGVSVGRYTTGSAGSSGRIGALIEGNNWRKYQIDGNINTLQAVVKPVEGLELKINYSNSIKREDKTYRLSPFQLLKGNKLSLSEGGLNRISEYRWKDHYQAVNLFGTYTKSILNKHHFKLMLGMNQEQFDRDRVYAEKDDVVSRSISNLNLGTNMLDIGGNTLDWAIEGVFGRLNYDYREKYLLEFNARYDGSSRFPDGNQWGIFPSGGVGWRIDKENFWSPLKNIISLFKVRVSYGSLGNQVVPVNTFRSLIRMGKSDWLMDYNKINYAAIPLPLPESIGWEDVNSFNMGFNFGFLDNKITASLDWYQRETKNMYLPGKPLPAVFGATEPKKNYASLRNRGFEINLGYHDSFDLYGSKLSLDVSANVSNFKAVITKFDNPKGIMSSFWEGERIGELWGYHIKGQFQSDEEAKKFQDKFSGDLPRKLGKVYKDIFVNISNSKWSHLKAGDIIYTDENGDGKIDDGQNTLEDHGDLVPIGNALPRFPFGFSINVNWKGFDLSIIGQGVGKQDWFPRGPLYWGMFHRPYISFLRKDLLSHTWDPNSSDNSDNYYPQSKRAYSEYDEGRSLYNLNDYYLTNVGYLRIKNLTVGYTLPKALTQKVDINRLRIFLSCENIFTFRFNSRLGKLTKYLDPEMVGSYVSISNPNTATYQGNVNTSLYPMNKTLSVGLIIDL